MAMALTPRKEDIYESLTLPNYHVLKEGILYSYNRRVKNWLKRYWYLIDDGTMLGYKERRRNDLKSPLVHFPIKKAQVFEIDQIEGVNVENAFVIRGIYWVSAKEKVYKAQTAEERQEWIIAIEKLNLILASNQTSPDVKISTESEARESSGASYSDDSKPGASGVNPSPKKSLQNFITLKVIGKGSYGEVRLTREVGTEKLFAVKLLDKNLILKKDKVTNALTENRILQKLDHQFLIKLRYSFTTAEHVVFVMDYANGGDLFTHLYGPDNQGPFDEDRTRFYGAELCLAIGYLHKRNIIHRDIKLENILLDIEGHVVLTDLGVSKESISFFSRTQSLVGTPQYMAPEVINENGYGRSVDWWCYGLVLFEMLTGRLPFPIHPNDSASDIYKKIVNDKIDIPENLSHLSSFILEDLLKKNPFERLGCGPDDHIEITRHLFYEPIIWRDIKDKRIPPPFRPNVQSDTDTKYFDLAYTEESIPSFPGCDREWAPDAKEKAFDEFKDFDYTYKEEEEEEEAVAEKREDDGGDDDDDDDDKEDKSRYARTLLF